MSITVIMIITKIWNTLTIMRKQVKYGRNLHINGFMFVHGKKHGIEIGDNVTINSSENVNPTSGVNHTHLRTEGEGMIVIGNHVGISHVNITSFCSITIDDNVLIGSGVKMWDTDFHPLEYTARMRQEKPDMKPIHIMEGAFIGACSIILKGVTVGKHAVVGAGSVVTKSIPDNEIWGGAPARFLRRINE